MACFPVLNGLAYELVRTVCKENRARVGITIVNMVDSVCLFVGSCKLVLFDYIIDIIVNSCASDKPRLASAVHNLTVNINAGSLVLLADAVCYEFIKVFSRLEINLFVIKIN